MLDVTTTITFPKPSWTDERVADLRRLYPDHSAGDIARIMGPGLSRNAVIGKLNRLGLYRGAEVARRLKSGKGTKRPRRRRNLLLEATFSGDAGQRYLAQRLAKPQPDPVTDLPPYQSDDAVSLFEIGERQCRWPLNDPGPGFLFCGAKTSDSCSWCVRHARMAFTPNGYQRSPYVPPRGQRV